MDRLRDGWALLRRGLGWYGRHGVLSSWDRLTRWAVDRRGPDARSYERWIASRGARLAAAASASPPPLATSVDVVVPVRDPEPEHLSQALASVLDQAGEGLTLILVDAGCERPDVRALLAEAAGDPRVRLVGGVPAGISAATNAGVAAGGGRVIVLLDHDDRLAAGVLPALATAFADDAGLEFVSTDEDQLTPDGRRVAPVFRGRPSAWQVLHLNAVTHLMALGRDLWDRLGGLRPAYDGAQDHDLALRALEQARGVRHLPRIGYHWRRAPGSVASTATAKPWAFEAGRRAVAEACRRRGFGATVRPGALPGVWRLDLPAPSEPLPARVVLHGRGAPAAVWRDVLAAAGVAVRSLDEQCWPAVDALPWLVLDRGLAPDPAGLAELLAWSAVPGAPTALASGAVAGRRRLHLGHALDRSGRATPILPGLPLGAAGPGLAALAPRELACSGDQLLLLREPAASGAGRLTGRPVERVDVLALSAARGAGVLHLPGDGLACGRGAGAWPGPVDLSASPLWPLVRERQPWRGTADPWCPRHDLLTPLGQPPPADAAEG